MSESVARAPSGSGSPWYRHGWPWFIAALLGVSVVASLATVGIAYRYADVDVRSVAQGPSISPSDDRAKAD